MQPKVASLHMPVLTGLDAADTGMAPMPHPSRPTPCPKQVMVHPHISETLTITLLNCRQVCLRQGCTLLATYKCTLGQFGGFGTTGEKLGSDGMSGGL